MIQRRSQKRRIRRYSTGFEVREGQEGVQYEMSIVLVAEVFDCGEVVDVQGRFR